MYYGSGLSEVVEWYCSEDGDVGDRAVGSREDGVDGDVRMEMLLMPVTTKMETVVSIAVRAWQWCRS